MSKRCIGERIYQKCGEYLEIKEILPAGRYMVVFESGIVKPCSEYAISNGLVTNSIRKKRHVGERVLQNCGDYAEIMEFLHGDKCIVRFDNGVMKVCRFDSIRKGQISSSFGSERCSNYIGLRRMQNCGEEAEIIELLPKNKCRVRFDDGFEKVITRHAFKKGMVGGSGKTKRIYLSVGQRVLQNCGEYAEIIELSKNRCVVKFDDGSVVKTYRKSFIDGKVEKYEGVADSSEPRNSMCIGSKYTQNCGAVAEIVETLPDDYIIVKFEDSSLVKSRRKTMLRKGIKPSFISRAGCQYRYNETGEILLSMYYDDSKGHYVGVLRRDDGTRYVRVLKENNNE